MGQCQQCRQAECQQCRQADISEPVSKIGVVSHPKRFSVALSSSSKQAEEQRSLAHFSEFLPLQALPADLPERSWDLLQAARAGKLAIVQSLRASGVTLSQKQVLDAHLKEALDAGELGRCESLHVAGASSKGSRYWKRLLEVRSKAANEVFTCCVAAAACRARGWEETLPDLSDEAKHGFAASGLSLIQLHLVLDQICTLHSQSGSPVKVEQLTTNQIVNAYLKPLTGKDECGCPGCAWYNCSMLDDVQDCPGPHNAQCGATTGSSCKFSECCRKSQGDSLNGYCQGCDGKGQSVVGWCKGGELPAQYFVSHAWGQSFMEDVQSLTSFAITNCHKHQRHINDLEELCPSCEGVTFWMCALAINQHVPLPKKTILHEAIEKTIHQSTSGIALILDKALQPFGRVWCLYELFLAKRHEVPLDIVFSAGAGDPNQLCEIHKGIEHIDMASAKSLDPQDKRHILHGALLVHLNGGVQEVERQVRDKILASLSKQDPIVRLAALEVLLQIVDHKSHGSCHAIADERIHAAMEDIPLERVIDATGDHMKDDHLPIKCRALKALPGLTEKGDERVHAAVAAYLEDHYVEDGNPMEKVAAVEVLQQMVKENGDEHMIAAFIEHQHSNVRRAALDVLPHLNAAARQKIRLGLRF